MLDVSQCSSVQCRYLDVTRDNDKWFELLTEAALRLAERSTAGWTVTSADPLYSKVTALVPWHIVRVQAYQHPKARRLPVDIEYTHRAFIGLTNDDQLVIETDQLSSLSFPRTRFSKPMQLAIFVYGNAPPEGAEHVASEDAPVDDPPSSVDPPDTEEDLDFRATCYPQTLKHGDEIWFEGVTREEVGKPPVESPALSYPAAASCPIGS